MLILAVDAAEVEDDLVVAPRQGFEGVVGDEHHYDVGAVVGFLVVGELEDVVRGDVGLYDHDVGVVAALHDFGDDVFGRGLTQVVDVGLEGQAHHGHFGLAVVVQFELEHGPLHFLGAPEGLVVVNLTGAGDEFRLCREIGGDEVRVHGYAVTSYTASGPEDVNAGMLVGQSDEFPDVDTGFLADDGQFVGECYLHVARGVLGELAHLGSLGVGAVQGALYELGVECDGLVGRCLVDAADDTVVVYELVDDVAGKHTFGAVGYVYFPFEFGTLAEDEPGHLLGGAYG